MRKLMIAFALVGLVTGACVAHAEEPASPPSVLGQQVTAEAFASPKHFPTAWDAQRFYCHEFGILVNTARWASTHPDYASSFPIWSETTLSSGYSMHSALQWMGTELAAHEEWVMAHAVAELAVIAKPSNGNAKNFQTGIIQGRRMMRLCGFDYRSSYSPDALTEYICGGTVSTGRNRVSPPRNCR